MSIDFDISESELLSPEILYQSDPRQSNTFYTVPHLFTPFVIIIKYRNIPIQQSDYDQVADACEQVRQKKTTSKTAVFPNTLLSQNADFTLEYAAATIPDQASLNASLYTAAEGRIGGNRDESLSCPHVQHALENKEHEGKNRHKAASCVKSLNYNSGGHGSRTRNPVKGTSFPMRPLAIRLPSEHLPHYNLLLELGKMAFFCKLCTPFGRKINGEDYATHLYIHHYRLYQFCRFYRLRSVNSGHRVDVSVADQFAVAFRNHVGNDRHFHADGTSHSDD